MRVLLPAIYSINQKRLGNEIRRLSIPAIELEAETLRYSNNKHSGYLIRSPELGYEIAVLKKAVTYPAELRWIVIADIGENFAELNLCSASWARHPDIQVEPINYDQAFRQTLASWHDAFHYVPEIPAQAIIGLRPPQIGAIHAVHAHWAVSEAVATVVLPTGTGKTETMLSLLITAAATKLLVVVPTDVLRTQLSEKFLSLGVLKHPDSTVLSKSAQTPVVCSLRHVPRTADEVDQVFEAAHVIVATSSILSKSTPDVRRRMAQHCPYLFIDEAHHAEAPSWATFRETFVAARVVQFTATPFREDGKLLEGKIVFNYPLRKAQVEQYFRPITFAPVIEYDTKQSDRAIAERAIAQLKVDRDKGHIVMARVATVTRAQQVYPLYASHPEFNPVELHTGIKSVKRREELRQQVISGHSRIVVCVDMLGEGFDLPELKIAAFHDIKKSLAVTLQLAGRFTRGRNDLGDPTFIANTAYVDVQEELKKLYARDPDWNVLLPLISERLVGEQMTLHEFISGFPTLADEIPIKALRPALSMVAYKTTCSRWTPENYAAGLPGKSSFEKVMSTVNEAEHTLIIVTAERDSVDWIEVETLPTYSWNLYIAIWDPKQDLLFIHGSANASTYTSLAKAICGEDVALIRGQDVFKAFSGVSRLMFRNVGLKEQLGRNLRYTSRMGRHVAPGISELQKRNTTKSMLSGSGFEGGVEISVGASEKGRLWTHRRDRVDHLITWSKSMGRKLLDRTLDPNEILKGTLDAKLVVRRPNASPILVDWPFEVYEESERFWKISFGENDTSDLLFHELRLNAPAESGALQFRIDSGTASALFEFRLKGDEESPDFEIVQLSEPPVKILRGGQRDAIPLTAFLYEYPPIFWFHNGSSLEGNELVALRQAPPALERDHIEVIDWSGINLSKESQGPEKDPVSIQARTIAYLRTQDWDVVVDDDGSGEAADVVCIKVLKEDDRPVQLKAAFYHCKFASEGKPAAVIKDLYEVCGQSQKCVSWIASPKRRTELFTHLLARNARRNKSGISSRIEVGSVEDLETIREISKQCPMTLHVVVVQPGLQRERASDAQLLLLGVAQNYLHETYQASFGVIASN